MTDIIDKAMLIGAGVEKGIKDLLGELEKKGQVERGAKGDKAQGDARGEDESGDESVVEPGTLDLRPRQRLENRIVEDGIKAIKELMSVLQLGREKVEGEACEAAETLAARFKLASSDELETVKEMALHFKGKVKKGPNSKLSKKQKMITS